MNITLIAGLFALSFIYAYFLYKKRELLSFKDTYYTEIKLIFEVTKTASHKSSLEIAKLSEWVKADLPLLTIMTVTTNPDIAAMQEKYNIDEATFLKIFTSISNELTEEITTKFNSTADNIQKVYQEELSKLTKEERSNVLK